MTEVSIFQETHGDATLTSTLNVASYMVLGAETNSNEIMSKNMIVTVFIISLLLFTGIKVYICIKYSTKCVNMSLH